MTAAPFLKDLALHLPLPPHERRRADLYALIGSLLLRPTRGLVEALAEEPVASAAETRHGDRTSLLAAWQHLLAAARSCGADAVQQEHAALFVAVGTPRIDAYASHYVAGYLMDEPLARLRADLRALGLARRHDAAHTEDHLGALCESMRLLITGTAGPGGLPRQPLSVQQRFFESHLLPWAPACLHDIGQADGARFYAALALLAQAFLDTECAGFELGDSLDSEPPEAPHAIAAHPVSDRDAASA